MFGPDTQQLYAEAQKMERIMQRIPGLTEVSSDLQIRNPRVNVVLDRDRASCPGPDSSAFRSHSHRSLRRAAGHSLLERPEPSRDEEFSDWRSG